MLMENERDASQFFSGALIDPAFVDDRFAVGGG